MNIDDTNEQIETLKIPATLAEKFELIFAHQLKLENKYTPIEIKNGFWAPEFFASYHVDDAKFQNWLKGKFWRVTEEICEAFETLPSSEDLHHWRHSWTSNTDVRHFFEELSDALHFLSALTIAAGIQSSKVADVWEHAEASWIDRIEDFLHRQFDITSDSLHKYAMRIIVAMGLAANCLKNKPWKITQMQTDEAKFQLYVLNVWSHVATFFCVLGCNTDDVFKLYMRKNLVNHFRQNTGY